jgi:hypothetical protein
MPKTPEVAKLVLSDVKTGLPLEGQQWIAGMKREEREVTEDILNRVGTEYFVQYWRFYRHQLEYVRSLGGLQ